MESVRLGGKGRGDPSAPSDADGFDRRRVDAAFTVDVEDYYHVTAFQTVVRPKDWSKFESRIERNTHKILDLLAAHSVRGTFYILGDVAERFPQLVRDIQTAGHELACHSHAHRLVYELSPGEFRADTERALHAIEDAASEAVHAYRAPSFSITPRSSWAIDILLELGISVDSSIFPVRHDLYGFAGAPRQPFRIASNGASLVEFPPPTIQFGPWTLPVTGGGYLRQLPFEYQKRCLQSLQRRGRAILLYIHPWEFDPEQPRVKASLCSRIRHYRGLRVTAERVRKLLSLLRFGTVTEALLSVKLGPSIHVAQLGCSNAPAGPE
jgi:polysaccharide deacetylase family protein (PEP-CTERM system associated)